MHYCSKFSNCIKVTIMLLLVFQRFFSYLHQADGNKKQYYYFFLPGPIVIRDTAFEEWGYGDKRAMVKQKLHPVQ